MSHMYKYCGLDGEIVFGDWFDTSNVKNMTYMFSYCFDVEGLDLSKFDTINVKDMSYMFRECESLIYLDITNFNTVNVTDMTKMFLFCYNLSNLDWSNSFNNTGKVKSMASMFESCTSLSTLYINFDTSNLESAYMMFRNCKQLLDITFGEKFTTLNVTTMYQMFNLCTNLRSIDGLERFDTSKVETMKYMFNNCRNLISLNLSSFDTELCRDMSYMFNECRKIETLYLSNFYVDPQCNINYMFKDCRSLYYIFTGFADSYYANWFTNWESSENYVEPVGVFKNCYSLPGYNTYGDTFEMAIVGGENGYYFGMSGQGEGYFGNNGSFVAPDSSTGIMTKRNMIVGVIFGAFGIGAIVSLFAVQFVEDKRRKNK